MGAALLSFPLLSFSQSWVADSQYTNQPALSTIHASSAYLRNITGLGIRIGMVDSGINPNNLAFGGAIIAGYNSLTGLSGVSNLADLRPQDNRYHGSFVASEMIARRDVGGYFQGIAYNSSLVVGAVPFGASTDAQTAAAINYVSAQGVRVINNSWGYSATKTYTAFATSNPQTLAALISAVNSGAVVVFSAMNEGASNPNLPGSLPSYNSAVAGSWIAVAASTVDGQVMPSYSNQCGTSMLYCITAPGGSTSYDGGIVGVNGASNSNTFSGTSRKQGTSMAAPLVSGTVALVAEMFPWMSASQLTTSVLTTGSLAATPNTTWGRVLLRVDAAILGPGIFESTFYANTAGYSSTFGNNISGSSGLVKSGAGTLTLSGANTYSGGTTLSAGTIAVGHNTALGTGGLAMSNATTLQAALAVSLSNAISIEGVSTIDTNSYAMGLSGVVSGTGNLTKISAGTLTLSGANTYSGGTTLSAGTIAVAGASPTGTGDVYVALGGTLKGTGTLAGNLVLSGALKPGNSPGYLAVSANVTLNSGSTYLQDIAGTVRAGKSTPLGASGYYSYLTVAGQLTIHTGATLTSQLSNLFSTTEPGYGSSIYIPALGDRFRIVTAEGGIVGRFSAVTQAAELNADTQFIVFYGVNGSNSIDQATVPSSYIVTLSSSTSNGRSVASVLDKVLALNKAGSASELQDQLLYVASGETAQSLPIFVNSLSGEIHASSVATLPQTTQRLQQSVLARLVDYPISPNNIKPPLSKTLLTGGLSATNPTGLPTASMSSNPEVNADPVDLTSAAIANGSAWGEIVYQRGDRTGNSGGRAYNNNLYQVVLGIDTYINAELGLKLGGGFALSNTTVSATNGNSVIQQGSLFVYGKLPVLQDYVVDGMVSVGLSSTNLSRNDPARLTSGLSNKGVMGNDALVSLGLSRSFEYNDLRVTPYTRVTYQYVGQASYDEGRSAAALSIANFSGGAVRGVIGVTAGSSNKDPLKDDCTYQVNFAVGVDSRGLLNPTLNTTLGGFSGTVTPATAGSAFVQVGFYGTVKIAQNAYAYTGVSGEVRSGQTLYGGHMGLRIAF
jgi:autotransporter-associated beta strand protein